jgi:hypothetical protein
MSSSESHRRSRSFRRLCVACLERNARFRYRGEVRADRDHTLCFECYRGEINRARARGLSNPAVPRMPPLFGYQEAAVSRALNERQVAHRRLMLDHLQRPPVQTWRHVR